MCKSKEIPVRMFGIVDGDEERARAVQLGQLKVEVGVVGLDEYL